MGALAIVLLLGSAVRTAYAFPTHRNPIDADALLSGMAALRILDGDLLVFFAGGTRLGALECYLHAAFFRLAGVSRESLALAPLLSGCAFLVFFWLFVREVLSQRTALLALAFAALPAPAFLFWTYVPTGYANTLLFATATLWLAARIARAGPTRLSALGLGLCAGLGLWNSLQTLGALIPAAAWLLLHRPRLYKDWRFAVPVAAGFLAGGSPWIVFNLVYPLSSLRDNFAAVPASSLAQILENARYFLSYDLVELTVGRDPAVRRSLAEWLHTEIPRHGLSLFYLLALTAALIQLAGATRRDPRTRWSPVLLFVLIAVCVVALKVFSGAGAVRGATVRYSLLLSVVIPPMLASFAVWISRRSRLIAAIMVLGVLLFNASEYLWPWTKTRKQWRREAVHMDRLTAFLLQEKIACAIGDYWIVYPLNFLAEGRVKGIPYQEGADYYRYLDEVKGRPQRIALVGGRVEVVEAWMSRGGLRDRGLKIAPELAVAVPLVNPARFGGPAGFRRRIEQAVAQASPIVSSAARVEWLRNDAPRRMTLGRDYPVQIEVKNVGNEAWPDPASQGGLSGAVLLSYHWLTHDRRMYFFEGSRSGFDQVVRPGETRTGVVTVRAPRRPGDYILQMDLLRGGAFWFADRGNPPLDIPVTVTVRDPVSSTDSRRSRPARR